MNRIHPDNPVICEAPALHEFEYKRNGTTALIGFFEVSTGRIAHSYLNKTRTETDFARAAEELIASDPHGKWTFICDGLNTHMSETLVRLVDKYCGLTSKKLGKKGYSGILHTMKSRAEYLHDPNHRIRFVYTPKHCSWLNQIEIWFSILSRKILRKGSFFSVEELEYSIRKFINQYNLTASAFKWTFSGKVLCK